ncbi:MAG TPA: crosslink repair DNA glycosylase YcaQ family protein [Opitutaceae bacterium]|nr:crosslink repair DNA glycosylase YcaQ family protein [Opitutaceae bacterium]
MPPTPLVLDRVTARRFMRRALLLDTPVADIDAALAHHGYVQIDPINVAGRMHDLILRHRVAGYREGDLMRHLHVAPAGPRPAEARTAFEHHLPTSHLLVALPLEAWPHLRGAMRRRMRGAGPWSGRLTPKQKVLAERLLAEIAARGPLSSEDFADTGRARAVWGAATLAKATLQKLFFHGRLAIARRDAANRRYYDLPERVLPAAVLAQAEPTAEATARWEALLKLRQRRLATLTRKEVPRVADLVQPVTVDGCPPLFMLRSDLPLLEDVRRSSSESASGPLVLLAPLDPLVYDRRLTAALWDFDYTWEAYTPPRKRVRGYYALPVLAGAELVGHVDPKADRPAGRLRVMSRSPRRGHRIAGAVGALARFLGLKWPKTPPPAASRQGSAPPRRRRSST